jgi:hypothetical protein
VGEQIAEENILTQERGSERRTKKIAQEDVHYSSRNIKRMVISRGIRMAGM